MRISLLAILALSLAACAPAAAPQHNTAAPALVADGEASAVQPLPLQDTMQWAASVTRVDYLPNQTHTVKLFGLAGGDPAMNDLHTQLAFFENPGDDWRVFTIGDILDYRVLTNAPGRVELEIDESTINTENGEIGSRTRHLIVTWTPSAEGEAPAQITLTPARAAADGTGPESGGEN